MPLDDATLEAQIRTELHTTGESGFIFYKPAFYASLALAERAIARTDLDRARSYTRTAVDQLMRLEQPAVHEYTARLYSMLRTRTGDAIAVASTFDEQVKAILSFALNTAIEKA